MFEDKNSMYEPLNPEENEKEIHTRRSKHCSTHENEGNFHRRSMFRICFIVQVVNLLLFVGGYSIVHLSHTFYKNTAMSTLDSYFELTDYNTTMEFKGNISLVRPSHMADEFWDQIQQTDGIVALPTKWALQYAPASAPSPEDPSKSIYQVDVWHSIHCLYRIRNRLIANPPVASDDPHTLHCVDYIREHLMCHSDMTLQATENYATFQINNGHKCRDYGALKYWVLGHNWRGHRKYLKTVKGIAFKNELVE